MGKAKKWIRLKSNDVKSGYFGPLCTDCCLLGTIATFEVHCGPSSLWRCWRRSR